MNDVLQREQQNRWRQFFATTVPSLGDAKDARIRLALLATIIGGFDPREIDVDQLGIEVNPETVEGALVLVDGPISGGLNRPGWFVPAMQPNILGEWFVVLASKFGFPVLDLLADAWQISPKGTADFFRRVSADFSTQNEVIEFLKAKLPEHLTAGLDAYADVVCEVIVSLNHAGVVTASSHGVWLPDGCKAALDYAVKKEDPRAFSLYGDMAMMAVDYLSSDMVQVAFQNYVFAGKYGIVSALLNEGLLRAARPTLDNDQRTPLDCFREAERLGSLSASTEIGICSLWGRGTTKNMELAIEKFRFAADRSDGRANVQLGYCYTEGRGVPRDPARAFDAFKLAAESDYEDAFAYLGACHQYGFGTELNISKAVSLYEIAARKGSHIARRQLSEMMRNEPAQIEHLRLIQADRTIRFIPIDEPWADRPLIKADWTCVTGPLAVDMLIAIENSLFIEPGAVSMLDMTIRKIRSTDTLHYPRARLVELQVDNFEGADGIIISLLVERNRCIVFDGTEKPFEIINSEMLDIERVENAQQYLELVCATAIPLIGFITVVHDVEDIVFNCAPPKKLLDQLEKIVKPVNYSRASEQDEHDLRFTFFAISEGNLNRIVANVYKWGKIGFESIETVIEGLPVPIRDQVRQRGNFSWIDPAYRF